MALMGSFSSSRKSGILAASIISESFTSNHANRGVKVLVGNLGARERQKLLYCFNLIVREDSYMYRRGKGIGEHRASLCYSCRGYSSRGYYKYVVFSGPLADLSPSLSQCTSFLDFLKNP